MPLMEKTLKKGFTLVELLVVISIISLLASVVFTSATAIREDARDKKRLTDISALRNAFNLYATDNRTLPTISGTHCIGKNTGETCWGNHLRPGNTTLTQALQPYLSSIPSDPVPTRGWGDSYMYLDGFINYNCTVTAEYGKYIIFRPEYGPYAANQCPAGTTFGCCGSGGPCADLGGYYCAVKLD